MKTKHAAVALTALGCALSTGCGRGDDERVAALEKRLAALEDRGAGAAGATGAPGSTAPGDPTTAPQDGKPLAHHPGWKGIPLDDASRKGIAWLVSVQGDDGGWGQDGGHKGDARDGVSLESQENDVANTALVGLALVRAGHVPTDAGPEGKALRRAVEFVLSHVEKAPVAGLAITDRTGTQIQRKLGSNVDTFLASLLLTQVDGRVGDGEMPARVRSALKVCVAKIERHQQKDGSWNEGNGWAPVLATSLASNSLFQAKSAGIEVAEASLRRVDDYTRKQAEATSGDFAAASGGAGVALYGLGQAMEQLSRDAPSREANAAVLKDVETRLSDDAVISGFGSMGGEEFVSYMNVSDSLRRTGGKAFRDWNEKIGGHLGKLQNADGTWAGHHCITGRVACTASAVLTLLAERTGPKGA